MNREQKYRIEYGSQLMKYLKKFGLLPEDIAKMTDSSSNNIKQLIKGEVGLTLDKMVKVAGIFGVDYYKFANPDYPLPSRDSLPSITKAKIIERKTKGIIEKDSEHILAKELSRVINEGRANTPTTSKILHFHMDESVKKRKTTEITNLLGKSPRKEEILVLKKINGQNVYIHKDYAKSYKYSTKEELKRLLSEKEKTRS